MPDLPGVPRLKVWGYFGRDRIMDTADTTLTRGRDGLEAKTDIPLDFAPGRELRIRTGKSSRGGVRTFGSVVEIKDGMMTFAIGRDYSKVLAEDRTARTTERNVLAVHAQALGGLDATLAEVRAQYAPMDEHGPRCAQRFHGAAECDCGKADQDAREQEAA